MTRFLQTKLIPPALWNACDFVLQLNFTIAHITGKRNTAAHLSSRLEIDPNEKLNLKIREDVPTQPIEVNIQSTGIAEEDKVFFPTEDAELPSEHQPWQRNREKRNAVHTELPVIALSHCYMKENCKNTLMQKMEPFNKVPRILTEQNLDPVLLLLKIQMLGLLIDEQILARNPRYIHYSRRKRRIIIKDDILYRQNFNDVGDINRQHVLLPVQLKDVLLNSLHGEAGKHPIISEMMQENRQK